MATKEEEEKAKRDLLNSDTPEGKAARAERAAIRATTRNYGQPNIIWPKGPNRGRPVEQYGRVTYPDDPAKQKPAQPQGTPSQGADASESVQRTVRDVAKEGVAGATKTVGDVSLEGVKTASRMKSGAEQYVGGQLRKGAGALVDKASEMNPLDAMGAAAKVANQASNPIGAIAKAIGDIEVGGGGADQPAITNEPNEFDKAEDFLKQARSRQRSMSEEVANVMADIDMARAETGLGRESEDSPAAPEAPAAPAAPEGANDFLAAQKDFNEKFGGSLGRPEEGETGDQYEARLKQRNVERNAARKELAKLKPQGAAPATPDERVADTGGESTGIGFDDQAIDPDAGGFKAPTISPQASSSARATASSAPTVITDPKQRLKGRQEFGSYLENQLKRSGGNYTFNKEDRSRAKSLGVGRKEMDNFMNKLGRRDEEEEPRRRRRLGQIGGNKFGA